ncbi:MAG: hypothetical protein KH542_10610 [Streptococcus sp.]|uniref:hypothetical protein n=1 Tax=Streptococcus sp. TaxID=1306 RepID=UPI0025CE10D9|nr:hypothetical protein [Streptococcus sp.]MBS6245494.1 hypothetical protein [Streptococcus sp.]
MIKVEVQGVNVLDVYNQLKAVLSQFRSFVDNDRAMDDKALGVVDTVVSTVATPSVCVSNLAPQDTNQGVPTITVAMQPNSISMTAPNAAVQVTPTQVAVTAPTVNVATDAQVQTAAPLQTPVTAPVSQEVKKYTLPEIQAALAPLLDAGKAVELQQLMAQFGVQYLGEVPEDRYPELVNAIRGLGARI